MPTTITLDFHSDPSHGWLAVPMEILGDFQPSQFSYTNGFIAFLEEDCDAGAFIKGRFDSVKLGREYNHEDDCFIRKLDRFPGKEV